MKINNALDIIALTIQIAGTLMMAFNSPKNLPAGAFMTVNVDVVTPRKRETKTKIGLLILCLGFFIQLISLLIK